MHTAVCCGILTATPPSHREHTGGGEERELLGFCSAMRGALGACGIPHCHAAFAPRAHRRRRGKGATWFLLCNARRPRGLRHSSLSRRLRYREHTGGGEERELLGFCSAMRGALGAAAFLTVTPPSHREHTGGAEERELFAARSHKRPQQVQLATSRWQSHVRPFEEICGRSRSPGRPMPVPRPDYEPRSVASVLP